MFTIEQLDCMNSSNYVSIVVRDNVKIILGSFTCIRATQVQILVGAQMKNGFKQMMDLLRSIFLWVET